MGMVPKYPEGWWERVCEHDPQLVRHPVFFFPFFFFFHTAILETSTKVQGDRRSTLSLGAGVIV